ncbi:unnamed protein product [Lactuca saligna]|uniref:Uncharacterized protein n=1 Tax=Lactuca saligna TaxID=75948 RepID=A0AA35YCH9_LACSI|nr:unnamed protein product [Lactuca saligna]
MFQDIPASSKILEGFRKLTTSGFCPLTPEMQASIDAADKPNKGGEGSKKGEKRTAVKEGPSGATKPSPKKRKAPEASSTSTPKRRKQPAHKRKTATPSASEGSNSETESNVRIEENQSVCNEEEETFWHLKAIHEKLEQLHLASKAYSSTAYSKATVASLFERIMKEHDANVAKINVSVSKSADVCKSTTKKVDKLIAETTNFMENYITTYNNNTTSVSEAFQNLAAMFKTEKGVSPQSSDLKQGGESVSNVKACKVHVKPIIKKEPKGKEKLIEDETIIDDDEDEGPDEAELKRQKPCDIELNETQRIVKEAKEKERADKEAHVGLMSKSITIFVLIKT